MKNNKATTIANHIIKSYSTTTSSTKYSGTWVDPTAKIGRDCKIAHGVVIEKDCLIEDDVVIEPNSVVSTGVRIGRSSRIGANSVLANCTIGSECYLYSGVRIGQDGFGFIPANPSKYAEDNAKARPQKKPQMLKVIIHNRVEIGSNTCIDRGSWRDTEIKSDTKIDNLCQVGHNVIIGNACLIAAQVGIAGSCTIGNFVMVGGQSGIAQHLKIGNMARIAAKSGVTRHVADNVTVGGSPALPIIQHHRQTILLRDLEQSLKHLSKN